MMHTQQCGTRPWGSRLYSVTGISFVGWGRIPAYTNSRGQPSASVRLLHNFPVQCVKLVYDCLFEFWHGQNRIPPIPPFLSSWNQVDFVPGASRLHWQVEPQLRQS
ncbi:hypothetical protein BJX70DRAFT_353398 [Aspergillus crustosus]